MRAFLGLGSNMGDRAAALRAAVDGLEKAGVRVLAESGMHDTAPLYNTEQPNFLNMALEIETTLTPFELLKLAQDLERKAGRKPGTHNQPRPLDVDLLYCEGFAMRAKDLTVPHPRIAERRFVLEPLMEIAPKLRIGTRTVEQLFAALK